MSSEAADSPDQLYVFAYLPGSTEPVPAGVLHWTDPYTAEAPVHFRYGRRYAERPNAIALDPVPGRLPLDPETTYTAGGLTGPLSVFSDALPDRWGRVLLRHLSDGRELTFPELLIAARGGERIGALEFGLSPEDVPQPAPGGTLSLDELYAGVEAVERHEPVPEPLARLLTPGSSLGGARPKAPIAHDGRLWIAKFPDRDDYLNMARLEFATMTLARECAIDVPNMQVLPLSRGKEALLVERFDRAPVGDGMARLPYLSARSLCGTHPADSSYLLLADALRQCARVSEDTLAQLYRRMAFNMAVSNCDDHHANHGVLLGADGRVTLSPAFDVVAAQGISRGQAMEVGVDGRRRTRDNLLSAAGRFLLGPSEADAILQDVESGARCWRDVFAECGVTAGEIESVAGAVGEIPQ